MISKLALGLDVKQGNLASLFIAIKIFLNFFLLLEVSVAKANSLKVDGLDLQNHPVKNFVNSPIKDELNAEEIEALIQKYNELWEEGRYKRAAMLMKQVLAWQLRVLGEEHHEVATTRNNLAIMYEYQGMYEEAELLYRNALVIYQKSLGEDHINTATAWHNLGGLYHVRGEYKQAESFYLKALKIREKLDDEDLALALSFHNLGITYKYQGLYAKAEFFLRKALEIRNIFLGKEDTDTAATISALGSLYFDQGMYQEAEPFYLEALEIFEQVLGDEHNFVGIASSNLGLLYYMQGLYDKAEPLFLTAFDIQKKSFGEEHPQVAVTMNNLGGFYDEQGLYEKAEPLYLKALSIRLKFLGERHPETANSLANLAELYGDQGLYEKAEPLILKALNISEEIFGLDHPDVANRLNNLGFLFAAQKKYEQAQDFYSRALEIHKRFFGEERSQTITSYFNLGLMYESMGLYAKSEPLIRRGVAMEATLIQRQAPTMPLGDRQFFLDSFGNISETTFSGAFRSDTAAELALFTRLNRQGLLEEIERKQSRLSKVPGQQQKLVRQLRDVIKQLSSLSLNYEQRKGLRDQRDQLERELYRSLPDLTPRLTQPTEIAAALPSAGALVEFQKYEFFDPTQPDGSNWSGGNYYLALVLRYDGTIKAIDLGSSEEIEDSVRIALASSENRVANAEELWREVGKLVMKPLLPALADIDDLVISPDGELNRIPFAALPAPDGHGFLTDQYRLRLVTTGRELLKLNKPLTKKGNIPMVVANPNFDLVLTNSSKSVSAVEALSPQSSTFNAERQERSVDSAELVWAPLPGTKREGAFVAESINGRLLVYNDALAATVQSSPAPQILHIASHAFYLEDQKQNNSINKLRQTRSSSLQTKGLKLFTLAGESPLLRSGVVLAGANAVDQHKNEGYGDDGYLTALEVAQLDWDGTELVVISACESGKGDIRAGEGVYGLKRAIAVSGARSSLLSLWKVDDRATAAFMRSYYEKLKIGQGRADALATTQEEFRNHGIPMWRHPYVWAAFQLSGDWRPIQGLSQRME